MLKLYTKDAKSLFTDHKPVLSTLCCQALGTSEWIYTEWNVGGVSRPCTLSSFLSLAPSSGKINTARVQQRHGVGHFHFGFFHQLQIESIHYLVEIYRLFFWSVCLEINTCDSSLFFFFKYLSKLWCTTPVLVETLFYFGCQNFLFWILWSWNMWTASANFFSIKRLKQWNTDWPTWNPNLRVI